MQSNSGHFRALDALRGVAAIPVVAWHWPSAGPLHPDALMNVTIAVDFFFMLSGFVIAANYEDRLSTAAQAKKFMWLRVGRIYPLYLATLLALVAIELIKWAAFSITTGDGGGTFADTKTVPAIFSNIFMVQTFGMHPAPTWNDPGWSVATEMYTYLTFAALTVWAGARRYWAYAIAGIGSWLILVAFSDHGLHPTVPLGIFRNFVGFFLGIFAWKTYQWLRKSAGGVRLSFAAWSAIEIVSVIGLVTWAAFYGPHAWQSLLSPIWLFVIVLVFSAERGAISSVLHTRPLAMLGILSYSIYLLHMILIALTGPAFKVIERVTGLSMFHDRGDGVFMFGGDGLSGDLLFIPFMLFTICCAWFSYTYFEEPMRRWFRNHVPGMKARKLAAAE